LVLAGALLAATPAAAQVVVKDYKFSPSVNSNIGNFTSEIWARVWRPTFSGTQRYPLIVMLHGQHSTCGDAHYTPRRDNNDDYRTTGTCPGTHVVVKSHEGYGYLASDLASRGYIVVSINSNRGFADGAGDVSDDFGMLRARGRLVLTHLAKLSAWDRGLETTPSSLEVSFQNRIDFGNVGLMGHSRGGSGVRSAYADYRFGSSINWASLIPNMTIRGLLELAPQEQRPSDPQIYDALGVSFLNVAGLCDGELGRGLISRHFDRLLSNGGSDYGTYFKATWGIHGANHRYFNTEWQENDTPGGCQNQTPLFTNAANETGSQSQRDAGLYAVRTFFTATVGAARDPSLARVFDPAYAAPAGPTIARSFSPSATYINSGHLEAFDNPTGINSNWVANDSSGLASYVHARGPDMHDPNYPYAEVTWTSSSANTYLQTNWMASNTGQNFTNYQYLEFRVDGGRSPAPEFNIQLVNSNNTRSSSVLSSNYINLGPLPVVMSAADSSSGNPVAVYLPTLRTVRIPLSAFTGATLSSIRGARFTFDRNNGCSAASPCRVILASIVNTIDTNLARGHAVTTSSVENNDANLAGGKAVDNNTGSRWSSGFTDAQWIYVDLGWEHKVQSVVLRWEAAYGKDFKIQVSNNASSWTDVHSVTNGTGGTQIIRLATPATGRYVRMLGSKRATQYGYSLYELEVYGH
jgi:hypothetical protein